MNNVILEIDADGVFCNNLNNDILKHRLRKAFPNFTEDVLKDYYFEHLKHENAAAYNIIHQSFVDADYVRNLPMYDGALEGFQLLLTLQNADIHIHTLITGDEHVVQARKEWLESIECMDKMTYHIDHYTKKMFTNSFIVIEDSPENMERSNAQHKILIKHKYNEHYAKTKEGLYLADDFNHAARIAYNIVTEAQKNS